jgi:uncharacterized protein YdaU (DUF1376 family)
MDSDRKAKADIWMPLSIGDYLADTAHLSTVEHGAYLLLLMHYWRKGPLPNDLGKIAQIAKLAPDAWSIAQALLADFFRLLDDGLYHQKRADCEIAKWQGKRLMAKEKASAAARARWGKDASSIAPSIPLSISQSNAPSNEQAMLERCPLPLPLPSQKTSTKDSCAAASPAPALDRSGRPITLPMLNGQDWPVTAEDCTAWTPVYPGIEIDMELLKAREWLIANPRNRKTPRGMRKFIVGWLGRAQDRARPAVSATGARNQPHGNTAWEAFKAEECAS